MDSLGHENEVARKAGGAVGRAGRVVLAGNFSYATIEQDNRKVPNEAAEWANPNQRAAIGRPGGALHARLDRTAGGTRSFDPGSTQPTAILVPPSGLRGCDRVRRSGSVRSGR